MNNPDVIDSSRVRWTNWEADRNSEPMETPIKIESGVPVQLSTSEQLRNAFTKMKPGDSFVWPNRQQPYAAAFSINLKIITRKVHNEGYRVWKK